MRYIQTWLRMPHQTWNIYSPASLTTGQFTPPPTLTPGSDHLFAKRRRLLVTWKTRAHENRCYQSCSCKLVPGSLATISNDLANGHVGWCPARLHNHNVTTAILVTWLSARWLLWLH